MKSAWYAPSQRDHVRMCTTYRSVSESLTSHAFRGFKFPFNSCLGGTGK